LVASTSTLASTGKVVWQEWLPPLLQAFLELFPA